MLLPTGTVTFLFTDTEGSTRLWEQHPQQMQAALAHHDALLRQIIQAHHGHVFKTVGDAFCAAFETAQDGLRAALVVQLALNEEGEKGRKGEGETKALAPLLPLSPSPLLPLRVRIALHTGVAEERDNDYFGPTLNRVARLQSTGYGEQTLLSQTTAQLVLDALPDGVTLRNMGRHRLKDLQSPEQVWQLLHPALRLEFPPLKSLDSLPTNLPVQVTSFIGREQEMQEVKAMLSRESRVESRESASSRLVTLTGSGGCGKTRLALQVAAELVEEFKDGVWLVELAALRDGGLVVQQVASALGLREEAGRSLTQTVTEYLREKSLLLLLDNGEHLVEACAQLCDGLLKSCAKVRLLVTSREGLNVAGETRWRVPSLGLPDLTPPPPSPSASSGQALPARSSLEPALSLPKGKGEPSSVLEADAVRLFVERARLVRQDFRLTETNSWAVAAVCVRLDGIPLAIELAAARVRALSAEQIASRLDDRFHLLTGGSRTAPTRQQTLRALIDWSYDLLTQEERLLLRRVSVFAGGWTLEAAEAVCDGSIEPPHSILSTEYSILDLLTSLVDKSLVVFEETDGTARYRLLETVRQYGLERLAETGELDTLRARHLDFFLRLAEEAESYFYGSDQAKWFDRLELEQENLRLGLEWGQQKDAEAETALGMAALLWRFWWVRGSMAEGKAYLAVLLEKTIETQNRLLRAAALYSASLPYTYSLCQRVRQLKGDLEVQPFIQTVLQPDQTDLKEAQVTTLCAMNDRKPSFLHDLHTQQDDPQIGQAGGYQQTCYPFRIADVTVCQIEAATFLVTKEGFDAKAHPIPLASFFAQVQVGDQIERLLMVF